MKFSKNNLSSSLILTIFSFIFLWSAYFFSAELGYKHIYDYLIKVTSPVKESENIVVVTIDDQSLSRIGRWPWKRTYYADIFEYLENIAGAKVIAFDSVLVSYGEKQSDSEFFQRFSELNSVISGVFFSKNPAFFDQEENNDTEKFRDFFREKFAINVEDSRPEEIIKNSEYLSCSYPVKELISASKNFGSVLSHPGEDGIIRKAEHVFYYKGRYYPSMALAVLKYLHPETKLKIDKNRLHINDTSMPLEDGRFSYIKWYGGKPYKTISAWKIIERKDINPEDFKDKIVVVGATSTALKDIKSTPLKADYPGVYIQATLIDNLLNGDYMIKPTDLQEKLILLITVAVSFCAILLLPPLYSSVFLVLLGVGYFYVCLFLAYPNNLALDPLTPILFIICIMLLGYGYEYFVEYDKKRKTRNLIAKYVSKDIMETILSDIDATKLGGKRSDISILFVDMRNFTQISETLPPEEVSKLLNRYFGEMIPIIFKYKGTINKFIGDALLVIFGAPVENPDHPQLAVKCAVKMLEKVREFPDIEIGVGISTGEAFVGNIGSDERFEYTAIGNTVNIASRLENFNKIYKTSILISESTYEQTKDIIEANEIDQVCVTQNSEPIKIFELVGLKKENN